MTPIKTYLLLFLFAFFGVQGFSQNDFYNDQREFQELPLSIDTEKKNEQITLVTDSILNHGYFTEKDYNEIHYGEKNTESKIYTEEEIYRKEEREKRDRDGFLVEVAAEVVVEVLLNTVFIISAFWH